MYSMTAMVEGLTPLATGFCFGEGPRWFEGLLWFSDMLGEAVHTVTLSGAMTTLELPGHAPSGLGFRPDGTLYIVSTEKRQVLSYDGETVELLADLRDVAPAPLGDMGLDGPPDGIAIDVEGGVWTALTLAHEFCRVVDSGTGAPTVTDRIGAGGRTAIACALGGAEGRTLFLVTTTDAYPRRLVGTRLS